MKRLRNDEKLTQRNIVENLNSVLMRIASPFREQIRSNARIPENDRGETATYNGPYSCSSSQHRVLKNATQIAYPST
jgi:hypothetical protein